MPTVTVDGAPQASTEHRRLDIQGLRAIAVVSVVAFHAGLPVPGGFVGVDIFFVISGFVITTMLYREWATTGGIRFGRFYLRRFQRLTPALALTVVVTMVASLLLLSPLGPLQTASKTALGAMLLTANFVIARTTGGYFDAPAETNPLLNTWSLSVEEQFYLLFPALIALSWLIARRQRSANLAPLVLVGVIAAGSFVVATAGSLGWAFGTSETVLGFYSPFTRAWEFACGSLLALWIVRRPKRRRGVMATTGILGMLLLGLSFWTITESTPFPGPWTLLPVVGTVLLLRAGEDSGLPTSRSLAIRPLVRIGDWSYSIYLWHWPLIVFALILWPTRPYVGVLAAIASVGVAAVSYRLLEQPLRHARLTTLRQREVMIAVTLLPPMVVAGLILLVTEDGLGSDRILRLQQAALPSHAGSVNGCDGRAPVGQESSACRWNQGATGMPVYLIGDSHADHFSEGVIEAARQVDRPVTITTTNACPFVDLVFQDDRYIDRTESCARYVQGSLAYLDSPDAERGTVIISNSDAYWDGRNFFRAGLTSSELTDEPTGKLDAYESGLRRTVRRLEAAGHRVVLVQSVPPAAWSPSKCSTLEILSGGCFAQRSLAEVLNERALTRSALEGAAAATAASIWDPSEALCPQGTCSTEGPGYVRYRDSGHISVLQAKHLASAIRTFLQP